MSGLDPSDPHAAESCYSVHYRGERLTLSLTGCPDGPLCLFPQQLLLPMATRAWACC